MIDRIIMEAVLKDEGAVGKTSTEYNYLVMTGSWRLVDDDQGQPHILSTDDFRSADAVLDVTVHPECEVVDGERLVMYTKVILDGREFSLIVLKGRVYQGGDDEPDVG